MVKKYLGKKVLAKCSYCDDCGEKINIAEGYVLNEIYDSIELLEDNITLYLCDTKKTNDLSDLVNIRNNWLKNNAYDYHNFLTKEEIIDLLNQDWLVAVEGLGEIGIEDIEKL